MMIKMIFKWTKYFIPTIIYKLMVIQWDLLTGTVSGKMLSKIVIEIFVFLIIKWKQKLVKFIKNIFTSGIQRILKVWIFNATASVFRYQPKGW